MSKQKALDPVGVSRVNDRELWLAEAERRQEDHTYRCLPCLRLRAGLGGTQCAVRDQIMQQKKVVQTAIDRGL